MTRRRSAAAFVIALGGLLGAGLASCTKKDSLILLDLRASGPLGAPVVRIRLSAKGWKTKTVDGTIDAAGFRVGYYGPGGGKAVSVTAEAIDAADCVLGSGEATVPKLEAGDTSAPTTLFVRPRPENGCVVDAGTMDTGSPSDGSAEDASPGDAAGEDTSPGNDAGADAPSNDADVDGPPSSDDAASPDASNDSARADTADDTATSSDAPSSDGSSSDGSSSDGSSSDGGTD